MRFVTAALLVVLVCASAVVVSAQQASGTYRNVNAVASTISVNRDGSKVTLEGKARIKSIDKAAKTTLEADARAITISFNSKSATTKASGLGAVNSATMAGPVKMVYTEVDASGNPIKTTATADNAVYDGSEQLAHLTGNVKIVSENPAFDEPAVMTGDKATVNLKSDLGPDDVRYRIETPNGVSTIDVTPKAKAGQKTK